MVRPEPEKGIIRARERMAKRVKFDYNEVLLFGVWVFPLKWENQVGVFPLKWENQVGFAT